MNKLEDDLRADAMAHGGRDPDLVELERLAAKLYGEGRDFRIEDGKLIPLTVSQQTDKEFEIDIGTDHLRLGIVADTHGGSVFEQNTALHHFYRYADGTIPNPKTGALTEPVDHFIHGGDWTQGPDKMHREQPYQVHVHGADQQVDYVVASYPRSERPGVRTYGISGNHDASYLGDGGINVFRMIADRRDDIVYVGQDAQYLTIGKLKIYLVHPDGSGAYAKCFDGETEILTRRGWSKFPDLTDADEVATLSSEDEIEWQKPTERQSYPYVGSMYRIASRFVNLLVTPNHDLYLSPESKKEWGRYSAQEVAADWSNEWASITFGKWRAKKNARPQHTGVRPDVYEVDPLEKRYNKPVRHLGSVPIVPLLRFLGYYVAEGCTAVGRSGHPGGRVDLSQKTHPEVTADMAACVKALGLSPYVNKSGVYTSSRELTAVALTCGKGSHEKHVPRWIMDLDEDLLWEFFSAYMAGDGDAEGLSATTVSRQLADDLQEIAFRLGFSAAIKATRQWYNVSFNRQKNEPRIDAPITVEPYIGTVYDVTVPNHVIYVRRNGKACWSGNSYKSQKGATALPISKKVNLLLRGHYHSFDWVEEHGIEAIMLPCFQSQYQWLARKDLHPDIGGLILDIWMTKKGEVGRLTVERVRYQARDNDWDHKASQAAIKSWSSRGITV